MHAHLTHHLAAEHRRDLLAEADRAPTGASRSLLRRRAPLAALAVVVAAAALPSAADAAVANVVGGAVQIQDGLGEDNAVNVSQLPDGRLRVSDSRGVPPGQGCVADGAFAVICSGANRVVAFLSQSDDSFLTTASVPTQFIGADGDDVYVPGNAPGPLQVDFFGGPGRDRVDYGGAPTGVTVTKDEVANDGRTGRGDRDNIRADIEELVGSPFGDSLSGSATAESRETISGRAGDDVLSGGAGRDVFLAEGSADGADRVFGGAGEDHVSYVQRTRSVTVNLSDGGADDGEAGERDELREVESASGGSAGDTLKANPASPVGVTLAGGGGTDTITGTGQGDTLLGNAGRDTITALAGADSVSIQDGEQDTASCGSEVDTFSADLGLDLMSGCETVRVGTLRVSPRAVQTGANRVARLQVSWRHPPRGSSCATSVCA